MATLQSGKCFTVPTFFGMCCRSEWQERMYIYKWHEVDQTKHEIFCVHIVCNEIQVKVNLEITTFFFYLRFPYCPNFFWFGVVNVVSSQSQVECFSRFTHDSVHIQQSLSGERGRRFPEGLKEFLIGWWQTLERDVHIYSDSSPLSLINISFWNYTL